MIKALEYPDYSQIIKPEELVNLDPPSSKKIVTEFIKLVTKLDFYRVVIINNKNLKNKNFYPPKKYITLNYLNLDVNYYLYSTHNERG